jgi:hypothetical protein
MKSVGSNCSQSISFRMQVTVYYIVNDTHKVMMALILVVLVLVWLALTQCQYLTCYCGVFFTITLILEASKAVQCLCPSRAF